MGNCNTNIVLILLHYSIASGEEHFSFAKDGGKPNETNEIYEKRQKKKRLKIDFRH